MADPWRVTATTSDGKMTVLYQPTPKQYLFHTCPAPNRLYGGAAGGGKTHALRWDAYLAGLAVPGLRMVLVRRSFPELQDTHIARALVEAPTIGAEYRVSDYKLKFANGSVLQFGHCQDDAAVSRYLSTEYDRIYFDELVTFTEHQYLLISSRARSTKAGVVPAVLAATNPGGPGAHWIKRLFIDRDLTPAERPAYRANDYAYIPATLDDNPYLDASYETRLLNLPADLRRAYREGDWDIFPGQFFKTWRRARHVETRTYPAWMDRIGGLDWGYNAPGVYARYVCAPDGHLYAEAEYTFRETLAKDVAATIARLNAGLSVRYIAADPSMWARDGQTGETLAETFAHAGVPLRRAKNDRVLGWQRVQAWLADAPDGRPWLSLHPSCTYGVRTIPAQQQDASRLEDVDTDGEDHWVDQLRYVVMSRPALGAAAPPDPVYPPGAWGHDLQTALREAAA